MAKTKAKYPALASLYGERVIDGRMDYATIVRKVPPIKESLDEYLIEHGKEDLIV